MKHIGIKLKMTLCFFYSFDFRFDCCRSSFFSVLSWSLCNCVTMPYAYNFLFIHFPFIQSWLLYWSVKKIIWCCCCLNIGIKQAHWTTTVEMVRKQFISLLLPHIFFYFTLSIARQQHVCAPSKSSAWGNIAFIIKYKGVLVTFPLRVYSNEFCFFALSFFLSPFLSLLLHFASVSFVRWSHSWIVGVPLFGCANKTGCRHFMYTPYMCIHFLHEHLT